MSFLTLKLNKKAFQSERYSVFLRTNIVHKINITYFFDLSS